MLNIGAGEIAVIMVVALLILGPKRLPELARGIGKFLREFRRQTDEVRTTIESEFYRMDRDLLAEDSPKSRTPPPTAQPSDASADEAEKPSLVPAVAAPASAAVAAEAPVPATVPSAGGSPVAAPASAPGASSGASASEPVASPPGRWEE